MHSTLARPAITMLFRLAPHDEPKVPNTPKCFFVSLLDYYVWRSSSFTLSLQGTTQGRQDSRLVLAYYQLPGVPHYNLSFHRPITMYLSSTLEPPDRVAAICAGRCLSFSHSSWGRELLIFSAVAENYSF